MPDWKTACECSFLLEGEPVVEAFRKLCIVALDGVPSCSDGSLGSQVRIRFMLERADLASQPTKTVA